MQSILYDYCLDGSAFQEPNLEIDDLIDTHAMMALFDINDFMSKWYMLIFFLLKMS